MPNNYFHFKEFTIHQEGCSMKVCTDACLFGAYVSNKISKRNFKITNCLDIGAGTGLLSLMLAQKNGNLLIDAVEIEINSFLQAQQNFTNSKWNYSLKIFHTDIKNFASQKKYDLIITNPPFYENDLLSNKKYKNIAKHDEGLLFADIINIIKLHLTETGHFTILLPWHRIKYFEELAKEKGYFLNEKLLIRQTPTHDFFRGILFFSTTGKGVQTKEMTIKIEDDYTDEFKALLKDYYLKL